MKKQIYNPFLPEGNYIADGEPHVFNDRIYLFGSHDQAFEKTYCSLGYEFFSAPVTDLSSWKSNGFNFEANQDPLCKKTNRHYLYAPDCVKGNDGKYYLYYALSGEQGNGGYHGPIGVAVCDTPDGKYEFLGHLKNPDGSLFEGQFILFDPGVINDNGIIRVYYGTFYPFKSLGRLMWPYMRKIMMQMFGKNNEFLKKYNDDVMGPATIELGQDMLTVIKGPTLILPVYDKKSPFKTSMNLVPKDGHTFVGHGFYEASSIRKINNKYYFIYSSMMNHELCYAISDYPDKEFTYGGVIISNGDVGYLGRKEKNRLNMTGNIHGSIECINGNWYVFYHRHTHNSDYSRVACCEKIEILSDGSIPQVEMTSCGLNNGDLFGIGQYRAYICCNLTNGHMAHNVNGICKKKLPHISSEDGKMYLKDITKNTIARYKYFDLSKTQRINIFVRGKGKLQVRTKVYQSPIKQVDNTEYQNICFDLKGIVHDVLEFYCKNGKLDIISFELIE